MGFTPEQIKGRIKSVAKQNNADARTLMRIYMMERFLERLAQSEYRDNFIIKGGILVTAMIGVAHRSTMDIDTSMKNLNLSAEDALRVVNQVKDIDLDDGVSFEVKDVSNIMDEMEYPGIRVTMNANVGRLITPLKIDISTGDVITPRAIEFNYDLLLEDRSISLWSYNLETILAEKLQTVLARGILNTRMRDFYDIRMLLDTYEDKVNKVVLKDAFKYYGKMGCEMEMAAITIEKPVEIDREQNLKDHRLYWIDRRTQDVILSALALVVLSPVMLATAIAIVVDDPSAGPVFSQERIGRNGKPFKFYKFRSMCPNAEAKLDDLLDQNEMDDRFRGLS